ncbi:MAG: DUF86 domain-containing protein [Cyanobacteria bacterium Co-bin8]|nr:DUF86 domain-containing protein [Cyanobacteria bacterium Co-bin8]
MSSREWPLRVQDVIGTILGIQQRISGVTLVEFEADETLIKSVLYDFIVIGEASVNIPESIQQRHPNIPWRFMIGMRNVMAHEYFQVNLARVWATIQEDLPPLVPHLEHILNSESK